MAAQIGRRARLAALREIVGRCHGKQLDVRGETNRNHVFFESLADANAGVEPSGDDVAQAIVDDDVEHHVRVRAMKAAEPRRDELFRRHAQRC